MSLFAILKFLNKMFPLYTIFLELCSDFNVPIATASCIIIWFVSTYVISKFFKTDDPPPTQQRHDTGRSVSLLENTVITNFKKHSFLLKRISCQISEDRKHLMLTLPPDQTALENRFLEELESRRVSFFENISRTVEQKNAVQNQHIGEVTRSLEGLQDDFSTVKNILQEVPRFPFHLVTKKTFTNNNGEQFEEVINSELLNEIATAFKDCFSKLESETRMKGKEVIRCISRFLEQSQKDIWKELKIFSSAVEKVEKDREEKNNIPLSCHVEKLDKHLLETAICLNRQRFEIENLQQILVHFDEKFGYIATKFDAYWNQSQKLYNNAAHRLKRTVDLWTAVSAKVDGSSGKLIKLLRNVTAMLSDTQNTLKFRQFDNISSSELKLVTKTSDENFKIGELPPFVENFENLNQKFEDLLLIAKNTKEKLLSLTQASKSLQSSHDLINSITEGYNNLLSIFLPAMEKARVAEGKGPPENQYKHNESYVDPWETMNVLIRESDLSQDFQWNDVLKDLNKEFPNLDLNKIVSLLKDIVKTSCDLIYKSKIRSETEAKKKNMKEENYEESDQWEDIPSESLLSDMSSVCLVQNSDDSESEAMESCLKIDYS